MSELKFYESPFHVTHPKEIADNMVKECDSEILEDLSGIKIYVVCRYMMYGSNALATLSSRELAEEWIEKNKDEHRYGSCLSICEFILNDMNYMEE